MIPYLASRIKMDNRSLLGVHSVNAWLVGNMMCQMLDVSCFRSKVMRQLGVAGIRQHA